MRLPMKGRCPLRRFAPQIAPIPSKQKFSPVRRARHRVFNPKPPSERSQNPKTWGNWEGIGDFCLQKCQRGRQLSPLSEATRPEYYSKIALQFCGYCFKRALPSRRALAPRAPSTVRVVGIGDCGVLLADVQKKDSHCANPFFLWVGCF